MTFKEVGTTNYLSYYEMYTSISTSKKMIDDDALGGRLYL